VNWLDSVAVAVAGGLAGAVIGGLVSHWASLRRDRRIWRMRLVGEFSGLHSEYEAALIRFQRSRVRDDSCVLSEESYAVLCSLLEIDATAQRLWWEFTVVFTEKSVLQALWEYLRRISLTKQMLLLAVMEPSEEFGEAMSWIYFQGRKTIASCSAALGVDTTPDGRPFFLGMAPVADDVLAKYESGKPPWDAVHDTWFVARNDGISPARRVPRHEAMSDS